MRARSWNVTDSKKTILDLIIQGQVLDMTIQRNVHDFVRGQSVAETCFSHWGYEIMTTLDRSNFKPINLKLHDQYFDPLINTIRVPRQ